MKPPWSKTLRATLFRETNEGQLSWATSQLDLFSLQSIRRDRLRKIENRPKVDADVIASILCAAWVSPAEEIAKAFSQEGLVGNLYKITSRAPSSEI